jgi:hypothetical protein
VSWSTCTAAAIYGHQSSAVPMRAQSTSLRSHQGSAYVRGSLRACLVYAQSCPTKDFWLVKILVNILLVNELANIGYKNELEWVVGH